jgi:hypothetical protein
MANKSNKKFDKQKILKYIGWGGALLSWLKLIIEAFPNKEGTDTRQPTTIIGKDE